MRRGAVLFLAIVLIGMGLQAFTARAAPFASPVPTLELTPPFRPTPTGWPDAPFPTLTPAARGHGQKGDVADVSAIGMLYWRWVIFR